MRQGRLKIRSRLRETASCGEVFLLDEYSFSWEQLYCLFQKKKKKRTKENEISSNEQVRRFAKVKPSKSAAVLSVKLS